MSSNQPPRIDLTEKENQTSENENGFLGRKMTKLEKRVAPLVVIAIIAILIGLLVPAIQRY